MEDAGEMIEMIMDSGCRRTIVRPQAFKGKKVKKTIMVENLRTADGAITPNQGEIPITRRDASGNKLKVVTQLADVTKNLASWVDMVDRGNCGILPKDGDYTQRVKPAEETKTKLMKNGLAGARVPIMRKEHLLSWR